MAFDEGLAQRIREVLGEREGIEEKRMFGGMAIMLNGNMAVGVIQDEMYIYMKRLYFYSYELDSAAKRGFQVQLPWMLTIYTYTHIYIVECVLSRPLYTRLGLV